MCVHTHQAAGATAGKSADKTSTGGLPRVTVRQFAEEKQYNAHALFTKLFSADVHALRSMEKLWAKRTPPVVVDYDALTDADPAENSKGETHLLPDQQLWSLKKCADVFMSRYVRRCRRCFFQCTHCIARNTEPMCTFENHLTQLFV